jgi:predicted TPR repeat methyltransferase
LIPATVSVKKSNFSAKLIVSAHDDWLKGKSSATNFGSRKKNMEENYTIEQRNSGPNSLLFSPENLEERLQQAFVCLGESLFAEAGAIYQEVLNFAPLNILACFNLGMLKQMNGELVAAISLYSKVLDQEPNNVQVLYQLANAYRDQGLWNKAAAAYQRALAQDPNQADIHYNLGLVRYYQKDLDAARQSYQKALELEQTRPEIYYNLGITHFEQGDYDLALASYQQALALSPDDIDTHYNIAVTLTRQGNLEAAADQYLQALARAHDDPELYNALGLILKQLKKLGGAETCYRKALDLRPDYGAAYTNLAVVLHIVGQIDQAVECYRKAIEFGHQPESAEYMVAALTGADRQSAPRVYVRDLFDSYAENFDKSLTKDLGYNSPILLREMADRLLGHKPQFERVADLGCGTGLVGDCFRDISRHMLGVDLSEKMLSKAEEKGGYDELHCADIVEFLTDYRGSFDLVVAADVLIYLGDLVPFFDAIHHSLELDGHLLLTIEKLIGPGDRHLLPSGRYAYAEEYLINLADRHGFSVVACQEVDLRREKGEWLKGSLLALHRMAS